MSDDMPLTCGRARGGFSSCPNPTAEPHGCPYQSDVNDDDDFECACCPDCTDECAADI